MYSQLAIYHLATVLPAFVIGAFLLLTVKGTARHKATGKVYLLLMVTTATIALFMPAEVGPRWREHWGFIHLLCALVFYSVARALYAVRRGNINAHRTAMVSLYGGGILLAGSLALTPGRMLHGWLFD